MTTVPEDLDFSFLKEFSDGQHHHDMMNEVTQEGDVPFLDDALNVPSVMDMTTELSMRKAQMVDADNPLLEAARPLLRALADIPVQLPTGTDIAQLRTMMVREVVLFQRLCDQENLPWKHMAVLRYCLCTAIDEAINRTTWGGAGIWARKSLLIVFEGEVDGGEKFFLLIGRMAVHPHEYADVLEVLLRIVCLGFEGRYSVMEDGPRHLEKIRKRLMTLLASCRKTVPLALSAPLRDRPGKRGLVLSDMPLWSGAMVGILVLCALFGWYHHMLAKRWEQTEVRLLALSSLSIHKPLRLSTLLKREIARGQVMVDDTADDSHVVFMGDYMFHSGSATIRPEVIAILGRVADEIASVDGDVHVVGHSDSVPMQHKPDGNKMLSEARSANVADFLYTHGTARSRIHSEGRGDTQPLADNARPDGRALNRRVEIIVKRSEV